MESITPGSVFKAMLAAAKDKLSAPLTACLTLLGVILLCSLLEGLGGALERKTMSGMYGYISTLTIAAVVLAPLVGVMQSTVGAINTAGGFMIAFIPVFAGILIAAGRVGSAVGFQTALFSAAQLIGQWSAYIIPPVTGMFFAASVTEAVSPGLNLSALGEQFKKGAVWSLGVCMTVFVGIVSLQNAIATSADSVTLRTAKFFSVSLIPVVGGAIGDALGTVGGAMGLIKSTSGVYAILALAFILLPGAFEIVLWKMALSLGSGVAEMFGINKILGLLKSVNTALSVLLAAVATVAVMFIVSTAVVVMR
jgi:stage III sporulation protein AE